MRLFKVLAPDGSPIWGGTGKWHLPRQCKNGKWIPGKWMPKINDVIPCMSGYHLCRRKDVLEWMVDPAWGLSGLWCIECPSPILCEAEYRGDIIKTAKKVVVQQARLIRITDMTVSDSWMLSGSYNTWCGSQSVKKRNEATLKRMMRIIDRNR